MLLRQRFNRMLVLVGGGGKQLRVDVVERKRGKKLILLFLELICLFLLHVKQDFHIQTADLSDYPNVFGEH